MHRLHAVALDHVALAHVLIVLERHAAFLTGNDFTRIVLEALELRQLAFMNNDVVADETHVGATFDLAVGDAAAGNLADLRDVEDLEDLRIAEHGFAALRREQAGHRLFHVVDEIVDDIVVADFDADTFRRFARFLVRTHVERNDRNA